MHYGIALRPTVSYKLFNIYPADIKNNFINLTDVIGAEATQIRRELLRANSTEDRYSVLNNFLLQKLTVSNKYTHLDVIIDIIHQNRSILKVGEL